MLKNFINRRINYFIPWLAYRFLVGTGRQRNLQLVTILSLTSIAVATTTVILTLGISNGFATATLAKLQTIYPPYLVNCPVGSGLKFDKIQKEIETNFPEVIGVTPYAYAQILLQTSGNSEISAALQLKGIDPQREVDTSNLINKIVQSAVPLSKLGPKDIMVGQTLAEISGWQIGTTVNLLVPQPISRHKINLRAIPVVISHIFVTGLEELDQNLIICHLKFLQQIFPEHEITQLGLKLAAPSPYNYKKAQVFLEKFQNYFGLEIQPWHSLYAPIWSALKLEKYSLLFILTLILLLASSNTLALINMLISHKRSDLALLLSQGASIKQLRQLFLTIGCWLGLFGTMIGTILATILAIGLDRYPIIQLPDSYLLEKLPIQLTVTTLLATPFFIIMLTLAITFISLRGLAKLPFGELLKH